MKSAKMTGIFRIGIMVLIMSLVITTISMGNTSTFAAVKSETEPNDKLVNANLISIGDTINGVNSGDGKTGAAASSDADYFYFNVSKAGELSFSLSFAKTLSYKTAFNVQIVDAGGNVVYRAPTSMKQYNATYSDIYVKAGNYFVSISSDAKGDAWNMPYVLKLSHAICTAEQEYNNKENFANSIKMNRLYNASLVPKYYSDGTYYTWDKDNYTFYNPKKGPVTIAFEKEGMDNKHRVDIYVEDSKGKSVFDKWEIYDEQYFVYKNLKKGKYLIRIRGAALEDGFSAPYKLKVTTKYQLPSEAISAASKKTYTGKKIKPSVKVKPNGKTLAKKYYSVSYKNNKKVGKATIIVKGKSPYKGTIKKTFNIVPAKTAITKFNSGTKKIKATWKKSKGAGKFEIQYRIKGDAWSSKTVSAKKKTTTITGLEKGKTYQVRIRAFKKVGKTNYYSSWSKVKSSKKIK